MIFKKNCLHAYFVMTCKWETLHTVHVFSPFLHGKGREKEKGERFSHFENWTFGFVVYRIQPGRS